MTKEAQERLRIADYLEAKYGPTAKAAKGKKRKKKRSAEEKQQERRKRKAITAYFDIAAVESDGNETDGTAEEGFVQAYGAGDHRRSRKRTKKDRQEREAPQEDSKT